jgi:hypothetical protein
VLRLASFKGLDAFLAFSLSVKSEVYTPVTIWIVVYWIMTSCSPVGGYRRLGGIYLRAGNGTFFRNVGNHNRSQGRARGTATQRAAHRHDETAFHLVHRPSFEGSKSRKKFFEFHFLNQFMLKLKFLLL